MPDAKEKITGWDETEPYRPDRAVVIKDTKDNTLASTLIIRTTIGGVAAYRIDGNHPVSFQTPEGSEQVLSNPNDYGELARATSTKSGLEVKINRDRTYMSRVERFEDVRSVATAPDGSKVAYTYRLGGAENNADHGYKGWMQVDLVRGLTLNVGGTTDITFEGNQLYMDQPNKEVHRYQMDEGTIYTIGRDESNSIQTPPQIAETSRIHCALMRSGGKLFVFDDRSTYGTLIITPIPLERR